MSTAVMVGSVALKQYLKDLKVLPTDGKISLLIYLFFAEEMASIAMMVRSAVLNTTTFTSSKHVYLAKHLSGDDRDGLCQKRKRSVTKLLKLISRL